MIHGTWKSVETSDLSDEPVYYDFISNKRLSDILRLDKLDHKLSFVALASLLVTGRVWSPGEVVIMRIISRLLSCNGVKSSFDKVSYLR